LASLGFNGSINTADIKLYGNGGATIPENNAAERADDLIENAIEINDGGDGIFNGADFLIFYAAGPHIWRFDSASNIFSYHKNGYSDTAFYFITVNNNSAGKRISLAAPTPNPSFSIASFTDHFAQELDLSNLLHSGKDWVGEVFSNEFGGIAARIFNFPIAGRITAKPIRMYSHLTNRSVGNNAVFSVALNEVIVQNNLLNGVTGSPLDAFATTLKTSSILNTSAADLSLRFSYSSAAAGARGWLNQFTLSVERALAFNKNEALCFRYADALTPNTTASFSIGNAPANCSVWNISKPLFPIKMAASQSLSSLSFNHTINGVDEFIAFNAGHFSTPILLGNIPNQNIHNSSPVNGLIITHPSLLTEAGRLADFHFSQYGLKDAVLTTQAIYNEFGSGSPDPSAIRDCIKMYADKYSNRSPKLQYILLFGAGSFDSKNRIANNINLVPTYQSSNSIDPLLSYTSDDFFALTNQRDDINALNNAPLSLAVGRLPVNNLNEAKIMVDKIIRYHQPAALGSWRNELVLLADDGDQNLHLNNAELIAATASTVNPSTHTNKIYLDAFPLVSGAGGARFPAVSEAIVNTIFNGALIFNYTGHGNYLRLTEEAVLSSTEVNRFNNANKLPLFVTASCDFAPFDDPSKKSLGAALLYNNPNGAIGLLTTTRLVFASSNSSINNNYLSTALSRTASGNFLSLGESVLVAKNKYLQTNGDVLNSRKFALLGDPAMRLAFPQLDLQIDSINNRLFTSGDSLVSLKPYTFSGSIRQQGLLQQNFNGIASISIYDKSRLVQTLANTPESKKTNFATENSMVFSGKARVKNGRFTVSFILPKDIQFQAGFGAIRGYAKDSSNTALNKDAAGIVPIKISGNNSVVSNDKIGPQIELFLNDELFKNGGLSAENPILLANFFDTSGINATGNSIGHDIILVIDGNEKNGMVLNNFYSAEQDGYQRGSLRFQLPTLSAGKYSLRMKAWDMANNSNTATLDFEVVKQEILKIKLVKNFPNPFTNSTVFDFEHNQPNTNLLVEIQIYNSEGSLVKRIQETVRTEGTRNLQINWAGDSNFGRKLIRGIYFYRIIVSADAQKVQSAGQLLLL
jgi:hypothetical protein